MARVAFIKLFTGLNLGVSQLSGELQRAGHDSLIIYLKDYIVVPKEEAVLYRQSDLCGVWVAARAKEMNCNCFEDFSAREYELLFETLRDFRPDLIGLSLCSVPFREACEVTAQVKRHFDVPVIWGGSGPTLEPERSLQFADMVCIGEGEELIVDLARALDEARDYSKIPGLWLRRGGEIVRNPSGPLIDLDKIAFPDFDESRCLHINDNRIRRNVYPPNLGRQYHIMTSRGCPYSCSFCIESYYQDKFGKKDSLRRRSVDLVIEELVRAKQKHGVKAVMFYDDVFTTHPKWLREFAPRYKEEVGLPFWCYTYPRTTRKDEIQMLKDAGLESITMGVQSGSFEVLKEYNRPIPPEMSIQAARDILDCGVNAFFDLMTRSEYETEETCRETFRFLLDFPREMKTVGFYPMIRFPGYGYSEKVEKEKRRVTLSDDDYAYYHKLYLLTRTALPREVMEGLAESPTIRKEPSLLDPLLPDTLPFFYLDNHALDLEAAVAASAARAERESASRPVESVLPAPQFTSY